MPTPFDAPARSAIVARIDRLSQASQPPWGRPMRRITAGLLIAALPATACRSNSNDALSADSLAALRTRAAAVEAARDTMVRLVARGSGPTWRVDIMAVGLRYFVARRREGVLFPAGNVEGADSSSVWRTTRTGAGPTSLELRLQKQPCNDASSNSMFAYRALLLVDGKTMIGCAMPTGANAALPR